MVDTPFSIADHKVPVSDLKPGKKNIVICCDGTGNEFGNENSNVVKLYTALTVDNKQVGYYHPGVGTMGNPAIRNRVARYWSKIKGLAFAAGFEGNVLDAYRYLMDIYNDGDEVYIFGFSRGSYTARALAGLLDGYGLLCRGNEGHLPYAWRLYLDQHEDRTKHSIDPHTTSAQAFKETFSHKEFKIRFLGVWDTVSSVGWVATPLRLFNVARNRTVVMGRHAISIDERRCFYVDNLWGKPYPDQDLQQVWFAGAHSDIGGSYPQDESVLSNITLEWMVDEARAGGVLFEENRVDIILGRHGNNPDPDYSEVEKLYPKPTQSIVHPSLTLAWKILEILPHIYFDKDLDTGRDGGVEQRRIPLGAWRELPPDSLVHHTVKERLDDPSFDYHPKNLTGARFEANPADARVFRYRPPADKKKSSNVVRIALLALFSLVEIAVAVAVVLLIVKAGAELWQHRHCLIQAVSDAYHWLGLWVRNHIGERVGNFLFPN